MPEKVSPEIADLRRLTRLWGVVVEFHDGLGTLRRPSPETLLAVLAALGAPVEGLADVPDALAARRRQVGTRLLPPSAVAWEGVGPVLSMTLPAAAAAAPIAGRLTLEDGEVFALQWESEESPVLARRKIDGSEWVRRRLRLAARGTDPIPHGHHRLELEVGDHRGAMRIVSAPLTAHPHPERAWGVFLPLHALRERCGSGLGNLTLLSRLARWAGERGATAVGCLPLLAGFLDAERRPFDPSPYAPASRLFWNELWADLSLVPELPECRAARERLAAAGTVARRRTLHESEGSDRVGYGAERAWRRPVWQALADHFFTRGSESRHEQLRNLLRERPELEAYAAFRAVGDRLGTPWQEWPEPLREGDIPEEVDPASDQLRSTRLHLYAQLVIHRQMAALRERTADAGTDLYLDLPLGVHASSFDVWRQRSLFARDAGAGAPPDAFFVRGQGWGFPPLSPERLRDEGPDHFRAVLAHSMSACGMLRVDHAMQLERLYWIPAGAEPTEGTYVRYPREELLATVVLESHRHRCAVVGEDLGTVSEAIRRAMDRHGLARMFVLPFELRANPFEAVQPVPEGALAGLGTHDTATFAGFWHGRDLALRRELDLLSAAKAEGLRSERQVALHALVAFLRSRGCLSRVGEPEPDQVARAALEFLAGSPASWVLINLEDLWGEEEPQNVPGTGPERANWRRRASKTLADLRTEGGLGEFLEHLDRLRRLSVEADPGIELTGEEGFLG